MTRLLVRLFVLLSMLIALVSAAGFLTQPAHADEAKPVPIADLNARVYHELSDELDKAVSKIVEQQKDVPCLHDALEGLYGDGGIREALRIPQGRPGQMKTPTGTCPACGENSSGSGTTCEHCGLPYPHGALQGVGTSQQSLSYDYGSTGNHVSGVITRTKSANGEIEATVSVDIVYTHVCKDNEGETVCSSFHAVVEAKVSYVESEDHKTVSDIKVSNVDLDIKSLFCCKKRPRLPYRVKWLHGWLTPDVTFGETPVTTHKPVPSASPAGAPSPAGSPPTSESAAPAPRTSTPPVNEDPKFKAVPVPSITPAAPSGASSEKTGTTDYAPASTSLHGEVLVTARDEGQYQGATSELVDMVDDSGKHHAFRALTDEQGHLKFLPVITGLTATIVAIDIFHQRKDGSWSNGVQCKVTRTPPELPGTQPVEGMPTSGSAVSRASSVVDTHGSNSAVLQYQTVGTNSSSKVLVNGKTDSVEVLAASDQSIVALAKDLRKGLNQIAIETNGRVGKPISQAVVSTRFAPLPPLRAGATGLLTEFIDGVDGLNAVLHLTISGAATFADGSNSKWLPVRSGAVTQTIRAASHAGSLDVKAELFVQTPNFSLPPQGSGG